MYTLFRLWCATNSRTTDDAKVRLLTDRSFFFFLPIDDRCLTMCAYRTKINQDVPLIVSSWVKITIKHMLCVLCGLRASVVSNTKNDVLLMVANRCAWLVFRSDVIQKLINLLIWRTKITCQTSFHSNAINRNKNHDYPRLNCHTSRNLFIQMGNR